jgi:hypothetical protein
VERDDAGRYVLDHLDSPDGPLALVAFEERRRVHVGVVRDGSRELLSSIEVGRDGHPYEPYAWRQRGWAVAFGGVPSTAVRAEVRNDDGEAFSARIVPLSSVLRSGDKAAWGLAERCERDCLLVAFDDRGEPVTTIGEFAVKPRTVIGEGDDPVGGRWRLWIAHWYRGPMLELSTPYGGGGCGVGPLPPGGFSGAGRGHHRSARVGCWDVRGLVTSRAERVDVATRAGVRPAIVLSVPSVELGPCKAYVAFFPDDAEPLTVTAVDGDGQELAALAFDGR